MIKLEHTVFALPFALCGLILGSRELPELATVAWSVLAFAGARAAAMTLNRIIDAKIDASNPRTNQRAIPDGRINKTQALLFAIASFALMLFAACQLPPLCLWLAPIAVFWLSFYSFTKRFTWACHLCLGICLAGASLGGWIATGGSLSHPAAWILALAVATWVSGFDVIYACQDIEVDIKQGLFSMPACFGVSKALNISSALHVLTVLFLITLGFCLPLSPIYWLGVAMVAVMLIYEHSIVKPDDLSRINAAFFNINGCVSIAVFLTILLAKLLS